MSGFEKIQEQTTEIQLVVTRIDEKLDNAIEVQRKHEKLLYGNGMAGLNSQVADCVHYVKFRRKIEWVGISIFVAMIIGGFISGAIFLAKLGVFDKL